MNKLHKNIEFTIEHEQNNQLAFLDTYVKRGSDRYFTTMYHKKTFTGVYLNRTSLTARRYKIGLIRCMLSRIHAICTEQVDKNLEIEKLKHLLVKNDYPKEVVEKEVERFLASKERIERERREEQAATLVAENVVKTVEEVKPKKFIVLPFTQRKCEDFANRLKRLVNDNFPQIDFNVAFQTPRSIGSLFPFKDNIKLTEDKAGVVYRLQCRDCDALVFYALSYLLMLIYN